MSYGFIRKPGSLVPLSKEPVQSHHDGGESVLLSGADTGWTFNGPFLFSMPQTTVAFVSF